MTKKYQGIDRITKERVRQIESEGWSAKHDAQYSRHELERAALCYLKHACGMHPDTYSRIWPWFSRWWKPSDDPVRNLEKAGALVAAAIDRHLHDGEPGTDEVMCKSAIEDDLAHHVLRLRKENNDLLDEINDLLSDLDKAQKSILVRENTISKMRDLQTQLYRQLVKAREERNGADAEEALKKILEYKKKR